MRRDFSRIVGRHVATALWAMSHFTLLVEHYSDFSCAFRAMPQQLTKQQSTGHGAMRNSHRNLLLYEETPPFLHLRSRKRERSPRIVRINPSLEETRDHICRINTSRHGLSACASNSVFYSNLPLAACESSAGSSSRNKQETRWPRQPTQIPRF